MRILLIEDDRALCTALLPALQAAGYTVDTCHDGADGKALLCGGAYDVCVLDRMLPGLDGLSLLRAARAKGCTTPVLMLTALSGINDRVDGLDAGADDYLGKPFDTRELLARLRALTRRPGTTAESGCRPTDPERAKGRCGPDQEGGRSFRGTAAHTGAAADPCGAFGAGLGTTGRS